MPRVFVSYSHEESAHNEWVIEICKLLRHNGVDAYLDTWDLKPGQDTTYFMESQIRDSDFVILICTPVYAEKSNIPRGGVGYEKNIISAELLQANDLQPKFIPILKKGTYDNALPKYLGSKYAIDFTDEDKLESAFDELLRVIYKQPHPNKPALGPNPFQKAPPLELEISDTVATSTLISAKIIPQANDIHVWTKEAFGRFDYLRSNRLNKAKADPFINGFWQASFVLLSPPAIDHLTSFLEKLRASKTNRTGWDIGWVPHRDGIAPYPYQHGIEVWLAEDGDKGPSYSDFWRAETSGRFALFRGYQEDDSEFLERISSSNPVLDFSLVLWRVSEFLLYMENFSRQMMVPESKAILMISWKGLENRRIAYHKDSIFNRRHEQDICYQNVVDSIYEITACANVKKNLVHDVHEITTPLFEMFNFFSITEDDIKNNIAGLFDPVKEGI
jgi:hypothetical protein